MLGRRVFSANPRKLSSGQRRWSLAPVSYHVVGGRLVQYLGSRAARRPAHNGPFCVTIVFSVSPSRPNFLLACAQVILAIYYTIADMVLLAQCLYYRGFDWCDDAGAAAKNQPNPPSQAIEEPNERTNLLTSFEPIIQPRERRGSNWSRLSPVTTRHEPEPERQVPPPPPTAAQSIFWNTTAIAMVIVAGILGWWLSQDKGKQTRDKNDLDFNTWGQVFGWLCALLYLWSRIPQLVLNWRRRSTDGVSILFFLFACLGNLTYVLSIFVYEAGCVKDGTSGGKGCAAGEARRLYWKYILVNLSWLAGSLGTLILDFGVLLQFFLYSRHEGSDEEPDYSDEEEEESIDPDVWSQVANRR